MGVGFVCVLVYVRARDPRRDVRDLWEAGAEGVVGWNECGVL